MIPPKVRRPPPNPRLPRGPVSRPFSWLPAWFRAPPNLVVATLTRPAAPSSPLTARDAAALAPGSWFWPTLMSTMRVAVSATAIAERLGQLPEGRVLAGAGHRLGHPVDRPESFFGHDLQ